MLQTLRGLPIIPLADGRVVALNEEGVFFPMEETQTKTKKPQSQTGNFTSVPPLLRIRYQNVLYYHQ